MTFNITHITKGNNQKHFLIVALIRYHLQRNRYVVIKSHTPFWLSAVNVEVRNQKVIILNKETAKSFRHISIIS